MKYKIIAEGFVSQRKTGTNTSQAAGSRCVAAKNGELICAFVAQTALGGNDFKPMISRSKDGGLTWSEAILIWPEIQDKYSIFGSISAAPSGDLFFYGMRTPIDYPGEKAWSEATNGLKQNELVWTRSHDHGVTWGPFAVIPMPVLGSAEAAGAMCLTRRGDMICCYAVINTTDPNLKVAHNQVLCLVSRDQGKTWKHNTMLHFESEDDLGAESWVVELSDGRLLAIGWHIRGDIAQTNKYALSSDAGATWSRTLSTGIFGQSTALAPLAQGQALFIYNQRKQGDIGVWLALIQPTMGSLGLLVNERIWAAEIASRGGATGDFTDWTSYAFGEPSVTPLADGTILATLWALQPSGNGIRYVKLRLQ